MPSKDESGCEGEDGNVSDSQDSDTERFAVRHELIESVTDLCEEEGDTDDDEDVEQIFGKNRVLRSSVLNPKVEFDSFSVGKADKVVEIKQYDLGRHFDPKITTSLQKFTTLNKLVGASPKASRSQSDVTGVKEFQPSFKRRGVSPHYSELITSETISKKFIDWHFITENSQFRELPLESILYGEKEEIMRQYPTLESLLISFGVSGDTLDLLATEKHHVSSKRGIDTLCQMSPVDSMLDAFAHYFAASEQFTKYFVCLLLDRKVYESLSCDSLWCTKMFNNIPNNEFLQEYLSLVHPHDYSMHHRIIKLIPDVQTPLIRSIFFKNKELNDQEAKAILVREFEHLFDKRRLQDLLYFVLSVYGSEFMPFGESSATRYFKNCVDDLFNASASDVELSLISGILGVILKIRL